MSEKFDTIVAQATPPGRGAIAVVRVSGPESRAIVAAVFESRNREEDLARQKRVFGFIVDRVSGGEPEKIDQVVVHYYRAPFSYTGEDVVEINCHSNQGIVGEIIELLIAGGARLAHAGEFTRRAYLNGKMDLLQAEAVIDLINSETAKGARSLFAQLSGDLSAQLEGMKREIMTFCAWLEMDLDFSDEEVVVDRDGMGLRLHGLIGEIQKLVESFKYGQVVREGIHLVIIGRPNVGKSSLLNALLKEKRVIVSATPGTTRDSVEAQLNIGGYLFRITDTAGLRRGGDEIEEEGVRRTKRLMQEADIFLLLIDGGDPLQQEDMEIFEYLQRHSDAQSLVAINKIDLPQRVDRGQIAGLLDRESIEISSKTGEGIPLLERALVGLYDQETGHSPILTRARHVEALKNVLKAIELAQGSIGKKLSSEFIAFDLRRALHHLGEITGEVTSEEILQQIFSSFCVGK